MNMKRSLILLGLFLAVNSFAQDITKYAQGTLTEGAVYYLPKTELDIEVIGEETIYTPGELCQYANRYLGITNVSAKPNNSWTIKKVNLSSIGLPDPDNSFGVKLKDKSVASQIELTDDGIIKAINTTNSNDNITNKTLLINANNYLNPREFMTEDMLNATSSSKLAELVAKEIYNIRDSKNSLTRGQADYMPKDGSALKLMLDNLEKQEKAYMQMFTGSTITEQKAYTFKYTPDKEVSKEILFRISEKLGVLNKENLAGSPVYITIKNLNVNSKLNEKAEKEKEKKKESGIIYNIPGKALITIASPSNKYFSNTIAITQFGSTEVLSEDLFKKKINTRVIFNPITGAILKIDKD